MWKVLDWFCRGVVLWMLLVWAGMMLDGMSGW